MLYFRGGQSLEIDRSHFVDSLTATSKATSGRDSIGINLRTCHVSHFPSRLFSPVTFPCSSETQIEFSSLSRAQNRRLLVDNKLASFCLRAKNTCVETGETSSSLFSLASQNSIFVIYLSFNSQQNELLILFSFLDLKSSQR